MTRTILLGITMIAAGALNAQLHYGKSATLQAHMQEVNAQWEAQGIVPENATAKVNFASEADRIATHLRAVRRTLQQRMHEGFSAQQQKNRLYLLEKLGSYADRGTFPQNYVLPYRNPIFIDPHGTACAVGQLMIESGHRALAEAIDRKMETGYLFDIVNSEMGAEVSAWATEYGFTAEELAWIQPGYPPNLPWMPVGGGTDGDVSTMLTLQNGDLLVAGAFTQAGGQTMNGVAIWDGAAFTALGTGIQGNIRTAVEFEGDIYIGGSNLNGMHDLARWNGSAWSYYTIFEGKSPTITVLHVHNGELIAAGQVLGFAGPDDRVRRINSDLTYTDIGSQFNGEVLALETYYGFLIAGGEFTALDGIGGAPIAHLALLEGNEWGQFLEGTDAPVRALMTAGDELYIGGDLFANIAVTFGLARITEMGSSIELLLPGHGNYMTSGNGPVYISSLAKNGSEVYFGGNFNFEMFTVIGNNLGVLHGDPDDAEPLLHVDAPVYALAIKDNRLYAGGAFNMDPPWPTYPHLISMDLSTAVNDREAALMLSIHPNPATDLITVNHPGELLTNIRIHDAAGREVQVPIARAGNSIRINVQTLASGRYTITSINNGTPAAATFIKQ